MEKYKKIFEEAWKKHRISVNVVPFPNYRNGKGYYGYIHYKKEGDINYSLVTKEASTIEDVCNKVEKSCVVILNKRR